MGSNTPGPPPARRPGWSLQERRDARTTASLRPSAPSPRRRIRHCFVRLAAGVEVEAFGLAWAVTDDGWTALVCLVTAQDVIEQRWIGADRLRPARSPHPGRLAPP